MPNLLQNAFNNLFGSNVTYITNAYSRSEYVWIMMHSERISLREIRIALSTNRYDEEKTIEISKLTFDEVFLKRRTTNSEYLSVVTPECDVACINRTIPANRSYIVTDSLHVMIESYYGGSIWEDSQRRNHKPDTNNTIRSKIGDTRIVDCGEMIDSSNTRVKQNEDKRLRNDVALRFEVQDKEIHILNSSVEGMATINTINIHCGDKIKSSVIDGNGLSIDSLSISASNVTGKQIAS